MADQGPGPLTQAAIDKARSLPGNQLEVDAGTSDFRTVDLTVGVKKTWRNGWGVGAWVGAKLGAGKPQGSAGVTVTKSLGLLAAWETEVEGMNWLQRNLPARDSWTWAVVTIAAVLAYLSANFDLLQAAFELSPIWEKRIELGAGVAALLAAKLSLSWLPSKNTQAVARDLHEAERQTYDDLDANRPK